MGILMDGGFKMVTLSSGILAENETAECLTGSIILTFKEGDQLLDDWRIVLERLYPSCQDLLNMIPQLQALTLASWQMMAWCQRILAIQHVRLDAYCAKQLERSLLSRDSERSQSTSWRMIVGITCIMFVLVLLSRS